MPFRRIDIHAHLNFADFDADRKAVAARALDGGTAMINVGTDLASSRAVIELADEYPEGVYAIVGQHPTEDAEPFDLESFRELVKHPKVVGIGECGLDYFHLPKEPGERAAAIAKQKELFSVQISLANESGKPLMLHIRDAYADALEILRAHARVKGNSHFFAGTIEDAKGFLGLGFTVSFAGPITFAEQYAELVRYVPLDMMHAETDCPFAAPVPHRGKRNEPAYVEHIVAKISELKGLPLPEVEQALLGNARRVWVVEA